MDRSPTGSGVTARVALQYHKGMIGLNQTRTFQSGATGSQFTGKAVEVPFFSFFFVPSRMLLFRFSLIGVRSWLTCAGAGLWTVSRSLFSQGLSAICAPVCRKSEWGTKRVFSELRSPSVANWDRFPGHGQENGGERKQGGIKERNKESLVSL